MPAALAADGAEVTAGEVTLENDAAPGSGTATVDHLSLRGADLARAAMPRGTAAATVRLYRQGALWGDASLQASDTLAAIAGAPINLAPQTPVSLDLRFVPRAAATNGLRLG